MAFYRRVLPFCAFLLVLGIALLVGLQDVSAQGTFPVNGSFTGSAYGWALYSNARYTETACRSGGCVEFYALGSSMYSQPFRLSSSSNFLQFYARVSGASSTLNVYVLDYSGTCTAYLASSVAVTLTSHTLYQFNFPSGCSDHDVVLSVWPASFGSTITFDDFWILHASQPWFPYGAMTPIPVNVISGSIYITGNVTGGSSFPYGVGTPIPIDWSQYPTPAPVSVDWSGFPTAVPYPTAVANITTNNNTTNNSTTNNTTTNNSTTNNSYGGIGSASIVVSGGLTLQMTPFPYGAGTPIPIYNAATPTPTPTRITVAQAQSFLGYNSVPGDSLPRINPVSPPGDMAFGGGMNSDSPFDLFMDQDYLHFHMPFSTLLSSLPVELPIPDFTFTVYYWYPTRWIFAGQDILNPVYGLVGLFWFSMCLAILRKG